MGFGLQTVLKEISRNVLEEHVKEGENPVDENRD